jgi:hypothetical protein
LVHSRLITLRENESALRSTHRFQGGKRLESDRNAGQSWMGTMRTNLLNVRGLQLIAGVALCWALSPSASQAFTQEDQRRLCTPDVFRLCSAEIPDVERITACMRRNRANLSESCRSVFGKPAQSASTMR